MAAPVMASPASPLSVQRPMGRHLLALPWVRLVAWSLVAYAALTTVCLVISLHWNDGHLVYALDDTYIHLGIVRTLLRSHTLGISPHHFAPATSSPLWTALVTVIAAAIGLQVWIPLVLNIVACVTSIGVFWWGASALGALSAGARDPVQPRWWTYLAAVALPVMLQLVVLTVVAMEHAIHIVLVLAFVTALFTVLYRPNSVAYRWLYVLATLLPLIRLEGAFSVGVGAALLVLHRKLIPAAVSLLAGVVPTVLLGVYFLRNGADFFTNSIELKAGVPQPGLAGIRTAISAHAHRIRPELMKDKTVLCCMLLALLWLAMSGRKRDRLGMEYAGYFLATAVLHVALADIGWFGRYEAYLIALFLFVVAARFWSVRGWTLQTVVRRNVLAVMAVLACMALGFARPQVGLLLETPLATNSIYRQQYQMGRFIERYYPHTGVVANDVGVVSLDAGGTVTDLVGLGSTEIMRLGRRVGWQHLSPGNVGPVLRGNGAEIAVIYPQWYGYLMTAWVPVATWDLQGVLHHAFINNITPVEWYVRDRKGYAAMLHRLKAFEPSLPSGISVRYVPLSR